MSKIKTFNIRHEDHQIILESENTRYETLHDLCLCIGRYFIKQGKIQEAKSVVAILDAQIRRYEKNEASI